jgi:hypothetical protein
MPYHVSPASKKNVTEIEIFKKDGITIKHWIMWRWGVVITPAEPDLSKYDPDKGINVYDAGWDAQLDNCNDGCDEDWDFPESMSKREQKKILKVWEEGCHSSIEELGWEHDDTELWFYGDLDVKEVE